MLDLSTEKDAHVAQRLGEDPIAWLGTVRPDGRPHLVPVWFFYDGESVLVYSEPDNQKVRNLRANPRVTLAIDDTRGGGDVVMVEGEATLDDAPATEAPPAYLEKYRNGIVQIGHTPESLLATFSQAIRITPKRIIHW